MEVTEREEKITEARVVFLMGGYGQFDLLNTIFTEFELLNQDQALLVKLLCCRLSVKKNDFKQDFFRRWLKRYRAKVVKAKDKKIDSNINQQASAAFQFTDPSLLPKTKEPLIKFS